MKVLALLTVAVFGAHTGATPVVATLDIAPATATIVEVSGAGGILAN